MKNLLLGLIVFLLLGIFLFLGVIVFTSDKTEETADLEAEETLAAETSQEKEADEEESEEKVEDDSTEAVPEVEEEESKDGAVSEDENEEFNAVELEMELSSQDVLVESVEYIVQDPEYKNLYPDMISAIVKNNSDMDIKNIEYGFVAWDKNGLPVRIVGDWDFSGGAYLYTGTGESVNIAPGETHGRNYGLELDSDMDNIHSFKAIVTEYSGFNGEVWNNPLLDDFYRIYEGKRLADIDGHEETISYRFGSSSSTVTESSDENSAESDDEEAETFITDYLYNLEEAYATGDFSLIESYLSPGSDAFKQMEENIVNNNFPNLRIYSVEVDSYTHLANDIYIEVFSERTNDNLDQIYKYKTGYHIRDEDGVWRIIDYRDL